MYLDSRTFVFAYENDNYENQESKSFIPGIAVFSSKGDFLTLFKWYL